MPLMDGFSQAKGREFMVYTDQHGREWEGWGDVKAKLHPTGTIKPTFDAPWYPEMRYARFGTRNPHLFTWDYDAMLADATLEHRRFRERQFDVAQHFNVPNFDPDTDDGTAQMQREIGRKPFPLDPIRAARAGNGYVLGLRPFDPSKAGDVKLKQALDQYLVNLGVGIGDEDVEFADDPEYAEQGTPAPEPKRRGRPRKAVAAKG